MNLLLLSLLSASLISTHPLYSRVYKQPTLPKGKFTGHTKKKEYDTTGNQILLSKKEKTSKRPTHSTPFAQHNMHKTAPLPPAPPAPVKEPTQENVIVPIIEEQLPPPAANATPPKTTQIGASTTETLVPEHIIPAALPLQPQPAAISSIPSIPSRSRGQWRAHLEDTAASTTLILATLLLIYEIEQHFERDKARLEESFHQAQHNVHAQQQCVLRLLQLLHIALYQITHATMPAAIDIAQLEEAFAEQHAHHNKSFQEFMMHHIHRYIDPLITILRNPTGYREQVQQHLEELHKQRPSLMRRLFGHYDKEQYANLQQDIQHTQKQLQQALQLEILKRGTLLQEPSSAYQEMLQFALQEQNYLITFVQQHAPLLEVPPEPQPMTLQWSPDPLLSIEPF